MSIAGLQYISEYITMAEEENLLQQIDYQPWLGDLKRRVQHYGYRYDYRARKVTAQMRLGSLPEWITPLAEEMDTDGLIGRTPDQVIVNEYVPGQGIASHVDCEPCFGETIISLSLGSSCVMKFTNIKSKAVVPILLEPRSLVIMEGEVRYDWKHGIPGRKTDVFDGQVIPRSRRVSVTFREVVL